MLPVLLPTPPGSRPEVLLVSLYVTAGADGSLPHTSLHCTGSCKRPIAIGPGRDHRLVRRKSKLTMPVPPRTKLPFPLASKVAKPCVAPSLEGFDSAFTMDEDFGSYVQTHREVAGRMSLPLRIGACAPRARYGGTPGNYGIL
ncbi:uncharacterized protein F4817DRAFT_321620 [Daldinia loculata]|uniref:uncharacterized protein n=1 Tax=Daldinia loculata TaxID=103429 RepID=UPI0020C3BBBC|nr:uncharacterized protein F4817DRAFT_321620 [Daldinia loculata]KAI1641655.1 hypothetical protein F4817DRAFT_321620 [Daldinia loculata]